MPAVTETDYTPAPLPLPAGVLPCPFCGQPPTLEHETDVPTLETADSWWLSCRNETCRAACYAAATTCAAVIAAWNHRLPGPAGKAESGKQKAEI